MDALVERPVLMRAGRALDITRGDTFVFESEAEMNVLMDYALYEYRRHGQSLVQRVSRANDVAEPDAAGAARWHVRVVHLVVSDTEVQMAESTLVLADRLQQREDIPLIDIMFSRTVEPGMLLFTRVIPLSMMNMTAGIAFVFPGDSEASLLRRYKRLSKRVKADTESARRLVAFFQLNRTAGIEVAFA